jgi:hypothetical protein
MSINGYFNKIKPEARMPKSDPHTPDELGLSYNGRVLNGGLSLMEALRVNALAVNRAPAGPHGAPDPVLRDHMRTQKT